MTLRTPLPPATSTIGRPVMSHAMWGITIMVMQFVILLAAFFAEVYTGTLATGLTLALCSALLSVWNAGHGNWTYACISGAIAMSFAAISL